MAKNKTENRYSGTDSASWIVTDVNGKPLLTGDKGARDHAGYGPAATAARQFTDATGQLAFARRA